MRRKFGVGFASAAIAAMALVGSPLTASADDTTATVGVVAGNLSLVSGGNVDFGSVQQDGIDHTLNASGTYDVSDATGSGAGWHLSVVATPFRDGEGHSLAPASANSASSACDAGSACSVANNQVSYPLNLTDDSVTDTTFFNAASGTGMGNQTATVNYSEFVPLTQPGGNYGATWLITLSTAP